MLSLPGIPAEHPTARRASWKKPFGCREAGWWERREVEGVMMLRRRRRGSLWDNEAVVRLPVRARPS